ncbi:uncharacterized protein LOC141632245 [Silene latifolia]|uniref:uncharacterized protein LOC141632245 n=1 Tax=Silene latifolia TaxID=37657 RepID=UPI003D77B8AB
MQENAQQIATLTILVSKLVSDQSKPTVCALNSDVLYADTAAQQIPNPKESAQAVTLRSGRVLSEPEVNKNEIVKELEVQPLRKPGVEGQVIHKDKSLKSDLNVTTFKDPPPFLTRFAKTKKNELENKILETFRKVELNIPLLDAIKQIPKYAKFLKELCTNKRNIKNTNAEKVSMGENVSALIQRNVPPKCNDPGMFSIPCT